MPPRSSVNWIEQISRKINAEEILCFGLPAMRPLPASVLDLKTLNDRLAT